MITKRKGIYRIFNVLNGHSYIGQTRNLKGRKKVHFSSLRKGKHRNLRLQTAFDKYGEEAFEFIILDHIENSGTLSFWEGVYYHLFHPEYNIASIPNKPPSMTGRHHSAKTRAQMSKTRKERLRSGEIILALKGKTWEEVFGSECAAELRKKIRKRRHNTKLAQKLNKERKAAAKVGTPNPNYGGKKGESHRKNISKGMTLLWAKRKRQGGYAGHPQSAETRQKMSLARKKYLAQHQHPMQGKRHASAAKRKMSVARKRWWARRRKAMS